MAQLDDAAKELVRSLRSSGEDRYAQTYRLLDTNNRPTGERVIIIAVKTRSQEVITRLGEAVKAAAGPAGTPCPCCGGSGRL